MARLRCPCGETLSNVMSPSSNNGWLLGDVEIENLENWTPSDIMERGRIVWECHRCGRIAIGNQIDSTVKWYKPEDGIPGNLTSFENRWKEEKE
jgi:hypothetical protein